MKNTSSRRVGDTWGLPGSLPPMTWDLREKRTRPKGPLETVVVGELEGKKYTFLPVVQERFSTREFLNTLREMEAAGSLPRLLVMPFLGDEQLLELQRRGLSGVDRCGNGVVCIPDRLLIYRTGQPKPKSVSAPTKYAYRGTTSLVARTFLIQSRFGSLMEIGELVQSRGGDIAVSTISKALKRLEADIVVDRDAGACALRQPEKLLDMLAADYRKPTMIREVTLALAKPLKELFATTLNSDTTSGGPRTVMSGYSSVNRYATLGQSEAPVLYTSNIDKQLAEWGDAVRQTARFPDIKLLETTDPTVYFDRRFEDGIPYASPIQAFLECATGDKRMREAAQDIKTGLLESIS